jgi:2-polyprenyl-6-methoxyphenol hydroxylase-like FAD-dependent oxidoreductase
LSRIETNVLIVGAGPVGLTLAMDLAWRGIDVVVAERREASAQPAVKCNQISSRSMEIFRRLGIAAKLREAGLPADYPNDAVSTTTVTGIELARIPIPCRAERYTSRIGPDTSWPTPEPTHRINQMFFEPILFECAVSNRRIRILSGTTIEDFVQDERGVTAAARHDGSCERSSIVCSYLVGCDGARSMVRKAIGARLAGTPEFQRVQSTCIRAPELIKLLPGKPAWIYFALNPRCCGNVIAIDGRETWIVSYALSDGERDFDSIDRDRAIRAILGVGAHIQYDVISNEAWTGRRLVADRFRDRRVFICGDAAHLWMPMGGYGMNAGIADAANLSWLIAATLNGWAPPSILDAYEAERQPVTDQVSRFTMDSATKIMNQRCAIPNEIEWPGPIGDAIRQQIGKEAYEIDLERQCCGGLNFGYFYEQSPIIVYDGEQQPAYTMHDFTSSTVPGCRAPHLWLGKDRSLCDALGPGYTLIRFEPGVVVSGLIEAAARRGVPLTVLDVSDPDARALYAHDLVLVRPDQHVAWRANEEPSAPMELIDVVRGARATSTERKVPQGS